MNKILAKMTINRFTFTQSPNQYYEPKHGSSIDVVFSLLLEFRSRRRCALPE